MALKHCKQCGCQSFETQVLTPTQCGRANLCLVITYCNNCGSKEEREVLC